MSDSSTIRFRWGFLAAFAALYCLFYVGYAAIPDELLRERVYPAGIVVPARTLIHWLAPRDGVVGERNVLRSAGVQLNIVRGCDGAGVILLVVAAILAWRARWRPTLVGIVGAVALLYALNLARIVTLYFVDEYRPAWFTPIHVYLIPTFMVLAGTLYYACWAAQLEPAGKPAAQG